MDGAATFAYEVVTLLLVVVIVEYFERYHPAHPANRRHQIKINLMALCIVIVGAKISDHFVQLLIVKFNVESWFSPLEALRQLSPVPKVIVGLVMVDFALYWVHRAMHASNLLWRAHRFHHTPTTMFWLAGSRTSFFHLLCFAFPEVIIPFPLLKMGVAETGVFFSVLVIVNIWVHMNVNINLGRLSWFFITPAYHRVHHSANQLSYRNLGFGHTLWDRMFGTFQDPREMKKDYKLGLADENDIKLRTFIGV